LELDPTKVEHADRTRSECVDRGIHAEHRAQLEAQILIHVVMRRGLTGTVLTVEGIVNLINVDDRAVAIVEGADVFQRIALKAHPLMVDFPTFVTTDLNIPLIPATKLDPGIIHVDG